VDAKAAIAKLQALGFDVETDDKGNARKAYSNKKATNESLANLPALVTLEEVDLWGSVRVNDDGLAHLRDGQKPLALRPLLAVRQAARPVKKSAHFFAPGDPVTPSLTH
jgi:hypothetical protein